MKLHWKKAACERPDPYLDWEFRTRREKRKETWCSVEIELIPVDGDYCPALDLLEQVVEDGCLPGETGGLTIRMADDEFKHLTTLIKGIREGTVCPPFEPVQMRFFVYRFEPLIYAGGGYANTSFYRTVFAGPPIVGLTFNDRSRERHPIIFPPLFTERKGVAIGIVDDGIAFAHERFRSNPVRSRVQAIWVQEVEQRSKQDNGVLFGQRIKAGDINDCLTNCKSDGDVYRHFHLIDFGRNDPGRNAYNPLAARATHGTSVLDLAAGHNRLQIDERPILAVQLPSVATIDTSGLTMGSYVLQAVRMIMVWADQLNPKEPIPLVINFSYGLLAGPKDGTQLLELALAELIDYRNRRIAPTRLVMPAGNSYRTRAAARLELKKKVEALEWVIHPDDGATNYVEIWLDTGAEGKRGEAPVEVWLTAQDEKTSHPIRPSVGHLHQATIGGGPIAGIYFQRIDYGDTVRERILLAVNPTVRNDDDRELAPSGRWKLSIRNLTKKVITAHVYVQRDDTPFGYPRRGRQSYLDHTGAYDRDPQTGDYRLQRDGCHITYADTLSSIATCSMDEKDHVIVVGAAEASEDHPPSDYTSSGPTMVRPGPDCSAFADEGDALWGVLAAGTFSGSVVKLSGTSVAAPQIVRQVADQLQAMAYPASAEPGASHGVCPATMGPVTIPIDPLDPRLGKYIFRPGSDGHIPKRRYPAV